MRAACNGQRRSQSRLIGAAVTGTGLYVAWGTLSRQASLSQRWSAAWLRHLAAAELVHDRKVSRLPAEAKHGCSFMTPGQSGPHADALRQDAASTAGLTSLASAGRSSRVDNPAIFEKPHFELRGS